MSGYEGIKWKIVDRCTITDGNNIEITVIDKNEAQELLSILMEYEERFEDIYYDALER